MDRRRLALRGAAAGALAALATLAAMYLAALVAGIRPLPDLLQEPILAAMPGPVFGFLIDNLQHAGKVVEEAGILVALTLGGAGLGAFYALASGRWSVPHLGLGFGALAWLLTMVVLLPLAGDGLFGLNEGLATPLVWGLLFAVFALVLQLPGDPARPALIAGEPGRRSFLRTAPLAVGALSLGVIAFRLAPGWYRAVAQPPESGLTGPVPEVTPIGNFYVVSKNFSDPVVAESGWALTLKGLVRRPQRFTLPDLRGLPAVEEYVTLECISNNVGGALISTGLFRGLRLADLLAEAAPQEGASHVLFRARDGYTESLPLDLVRSSPEILLADQLDGAPLPTAHGFPLRVLIPGHYGMKGPKWLDAIELVSSDSGGYWENQGWDRLAVVKTTSRIDSPLDGSIVSPGEVAVQGVAFAGKRGVLTVELSTDGGRSWSRATVKAPLSAFTWVLWSQSWTPGSAGAYTLQVRATDGDGRLQSGQPAASFPNGASGYHTVHVNVRSRK